MIKRIKLTFYITLTFFLLFAFPILPAISSAKLILLYVFANIVLFGGFKRKLYLFSEAFRKFHIIYYLIYVYTFAITVFCFAFEWTLVGKIVSSFFLYFVAFTFYREASSTINIGKVIVYCFAIQSIFILLAIVSESFYSLTAPFRGAEVSMNQEISYGRLRGNAICGYQFWGIASMYTFVIIFLLLHLKQFKGGFVLLPLIMVAAICSGRFSVVGIIIGLATLLVRYFVQGKFKSALWIIVSCIAFVVVSVLLLYNYVEEISDPLMYKVVSNYLISPIDSILYGGEFQTSSTDNLLAMYEKDDIKKYFVWGAGRFAMEDGSYFGGVDIGYYRMLGYYGILGFLLITYGIYYLIYCTNSNLDIYTKHAFFINFFVLNFKGDIQIFSNNIVPIIVAFLFFSRFQKANKRHLYYR